MNKVDIYNIEKKKKTLAQHLKQEKSRNNNYDIVIRSNGYRKNHNYRVDFDLYKSSKLKYVQDRFDNTIKSSMQNNDDVGFKTTSVLYDGAKLVRDISPKLYAINKNWVGGSISFTKQGIIISGKTYKIATELYAGFKTGTLKGAINMHKNLVFNNVTNTIKYSKPASFTMNTIDGIKTFSANWARNFKVARGVVEGTVKIAPQKALRGSFKFTSNQLKTLSKRTFRVAKYSVGGVKKFANNKVAKSFFGGTDYSLRYLKSFSNDVNDRDDLGTNTFKGLMTTADGTKEAIKVVNRGAKVGVNTVARVGKKTHKFGVGTYKFAKNVKDVGFKGASKVWYNAHLRGAGKRTVEKIDEFLVNTFKSIIKNPLVLAVVLLVFICTSVGSTAVVSASSTVGGVIAFFEELAESLKETIDTVVEKSKDFLENCIEWLKDVWNWLTGDEEEDEVEVDIRVDVDIGDSMSICDYLLGTVQAYKALLGLELEEEIRTLINDEGYHTVIFFNNAGSEILITDIYKSEYGLMADKDYVKAELPIWKAVIFGTIGTDFTADEATEIAEECFEALTTIDKKPYIDLDEDGEADYFYCDGTSSLDEGENFCVIMIGDTWVSDLQMAETDTCYNWSEPFFHDTHNEDGMKCCTTTYSCGTHLRYMCNGHISYCWDNGNSTYGSCDNYSSVQVYCNDESTCTNLTECLAFCWDGTKSSYDYCDNYTAVNMGHYTYYVCNGHDSEYCDELNIENCNNYTESTTYCWSGTKSSYDYCDNYTTVNMGYYTYYVCKGHSSKVCQGHLPQKCGGHTEYVCNGHGYTCWDGWLEENGYGPSLYDICDNRVSQPYYCYRGAVTTSKGCTTEITKFDCVGYTLCKGHRMMVYTLGNEGFEGMLAEQFTNRIEELEAKDSLTDEEREELSQLQMYYEYALGCYENSDPVADEWYNNQP